MTGWLRLKQARPSLSSMRSLSGGLSGLAFIAVQPPGAAPDVQAAAPAQDTLQGEVNAPADAAQLDGSRGGDETQQDRATQAAAAAAQLHSQLGPQHATAAADRNNAPGSHDGSCIHAPPARYNKSLLRGVLQLMGCKQRHAHKASAGLLSSHDMSNLLVLVPCRARGRRLVDITMAPVASPQLTGKAAEHDRHGLHR